MQEAIFLGLGVVAGVLFFAACLLRGKGSRG
jgi:hypothetical protein